MNVIESLILKLGSEGSEVAHMAEKCLLFGLDEVNHLEPEGPNNRDRLIGELNDILGAAAMLVEYGVLPADWASNEAQGRKCIKICDYGNYGRKIGTIQGDRIRPPQFALKYGDLSTPFERAAADYEPILKAAENAPSLADALGIEPMTLSRYRASVVQAAHDAADGNDGNHWKILEAAKPLKMEMAEFVERVLGSWANDVRVCSIKNEQGVHCDRVATVFLPFAGRDMPFCELCAANVQDGAYGKHDASPCVLRPVKPSSPPPEWFKKANDAAIEAGKHSCPEDSRDGPCQVCHNEAEANFDGPVPTRPVILRGPGECAADEPLRRIWAVDAGRWVDQHGNAWPLDATGNPIDS